MSVQIHTISFGFVNIFLLKGEKNILIDAGIPGQKDRFLKQLTAYEIKPETIDLMLFTHGHMDHIGLAKEIVELSGAQTAIHHLEKDWVESGKPPFPPGATPWGKFLASFVRLAPEMKISPTKVDIAINDAGFSLDEYGIPGQVIHTPGHTMGSVSILLENGDTLVGDLAMSAKILRLTPGIPIFAEEVNLIKPSWKKLLDLGAKKIYPAHGHPFSAEIFRRQLY